MHSNDYLMESKDEILRLELKTDPAVVEKQALWAGLKPGMSVADFGCGSGKTTAILHSLVQPGGKAVGVDESARRISHAKEQYGAEGIAFECQDVLEPLDNLGKFDFAWVRFLLEYYRTNSFDVVKNISSTLKPGGILCLIDLDYNCLSHYGLPSKLELAIHSGIKVLEKKSNFDPYVGRKLYSFLYDLGYEDIDVEVAAHHLIFGELKDTDAFNWMKKIEVVSKKMDFSFDGGTWDCEEFSRQFRDFFSNPRRFTYSPVISCRGRKPLP